MSDKIRHAHTHTALASKDLKAMSFMELMLVWRYGVLGNTHLGDEDAFWEIVKQRAPSWAKGEEK